MSSKIERQKIIIDTDPGTDDALAIFMVLEAHKRRAVEIVAITTVHGNTSLINCNNNLLHIMRAANEFDIPLYTGASEPLVHDFVRGETPFHGEDGFGDTGELEFLIKENSFQKEAASVAIVRLIKENKDVILLALAPLTNLAIALYLQPECLSHLKNIYLMGGNLTGRGNVSVSSEFNFFCDPEAAKVVLDRCKKLIKLIPWEPCLDAISITQEERKELGSCKTKVACLMNTIEEHVFKEGRYLPWVTCDQIASAWMLDDCLRTKETKNKLITKTELFYADVEVKGQYTRGQLVVDTTNRLGKKPNTESVLEVNKRIYMSYLKMAFGWNLEKNPWED